MGKNTFNLIENGVVLATTSIEIVDGVEFIATLERKDNYKGEFGFDWMRDDYKSTDTEESICQNYEALKDEYNSEIIEGEEYLVPWLSMYPNQEGVSLLLKIKKINDERVRKDDVVKLPAKKGIRFEPDEVMVKDIEKEDMSINIFCDTPLTEDTVFDLLDKYDDPVGHITIIKNDEIRTLGVKFIKVMGNEAGNTYNERTFRELSSTWAENTIDLFNKNYFNQALIQVKNDGVEEMIIDVDAYVEKGVLVDLIIEGKRGIPRYKNGFDAALYNQYSQKNGEYRGVIFFLSACQQPDQRAGHARLYPTEINYVLMTPSSVGSSDLHSYAHELGHTLGLDHTWVTEEDNNKRLLEIDKSIEKKKARVNDYLDKNKDLPDSTPIRDSSETLGDIRKREKKNLKVDLKVLENEKTLRLKFAPTHPFNQSTTENIMDYSGHKNPDGTQTNNPHTKGISFWRWQWEIMRNEITDYYGE